MKYNTALPTEDLATSANDVQKIWTCGLLSRQTDKHTDMLITILYTLTRGEGTVC